MKIAIIGAGNLGISMAKGLISNKVISSLYLTRRNIKELNHFKSNKKVKITTNNALAIKNSTILIFAVQPSDFEDILKENVANLSDHHIIISTITGFSINEIEAIIGTKNNVIRAMPNTAIAVGKSMTCLSSKTKNRKVLNAARSIFNTLGTTLLIPENQMQAATVVCASGIAFWMRLIRATSQAAIQLGFDAKEAQELAMHTCEGAANLLISSGNHPEQEIDKVTTPKGCTIEGLNEMEHQGLSSSLIKGMVTSFDKINSIKSKEPL
ncbi:MAG: pyrroline-5-carboxylate reductase [Bacteroidia bacterium]|nr:pyrroline-5-carboxylate reductase [Bacteroidia bacterium]NND24930.1 pyrroline-5-carboxylate reductase [Flavobacteriaceae bacterium]MBT8279031.1 pyrroline-5-carboxylate reductase [Bacteroidia bacterium]NNK59931.1 pyrroline-5-carboxylate reductase [Flavobacteriaceae bacterium]NNL33116.1 pyrroline-5-carboxylate reductase [Flavobacteriaceae bacterium]